MEAFSYPVTVYKSRHKGKEAQRQRVAKPGCRVTTKKGGPPIKGKPTLILYASLPFCLYASLPFLRLSLAQQQGNICVEEKAFFGVVSHLGYFAEIVFGV
jgi:hypothetical protein